MCGNINIKLEPWLTPNFVRAETPGICFTLSEASEEALSDLCDQFRAEVFRKAGKKDPKPNRR